jgi:hypothetical protein
MREHGVKPALSHVRSMQSLLKSASLNLLGLAVAVVCWQMLRALVAPEEAAAFRGRPAPGFDAAGVDGTLNQLWQRRSLDKPYAAGASDTAAGQLSRSLGSVSGATGAPDEAAPVEALEQRVLGEWHDEYRGQRKLTLRPDGTATMVVEPAGIGKKLFAAVLTFEIEWSLEEGCLTLRTLGGEPASKVRLIRKLYGDQAVYAIQKLDEHRMLLLDADGKTQYDWRRPGEPPASADQANPSIE